MNAYIIHGALQVLAYAILLPLGMLVAIFRDWIGSSWLLLHSVFQFSGALASFGALAAIGLAHGNEKTKTKANTQTETKDKEKNEDKDKDKDRDEDKDRDKDEDEDKEKQTGRTQAPLHVVLGTIVVILLAFQIVWATAFRHIVPRTAWYTVHIILAICIIKGGWINLYLGYKHYQEKQKSV